MDKLIEKEGRFYKECGVVMLESNTPSHIYLVTKTSKLGYVTGKCKEDLEQFPQTVIETQNQHLYITSDDEIKDGEYIYSPFRGIIKVERVFTLKDGRKCFTYKGEDTVFSCEKKIIASTDPSLKLPLPSDKFIQAYIDAYNQGNPIEKVLVECYTTHETDGARFLNYKLKDNNIIIKKVKDSWNRDEVIELLNRVDLLTRFEDYNLVEWIEENL